MHILSKIFICWLNGCSLLPKKAMAKEDFKDVAYFEPFYLKEFVASTPKKLL